MAQAMCSPAEKACSNFQALIILHTLTGCQRLYYSSRQRTLCHLVPTYMYILVQSHASSDRKSSSLSDTLMLFTGWRKAFEEGSLLWHCHWLPTEH
jgi:hypothetical protein